MDDVDAGLLDEAKGIPAEVLDLENSVDATVIDSGSTVVLLIPENDKGREWIAANIDPETKNKFGPSIVVERACLKGVLNGLKKDGLIVRHQHVVEK